MTKVQARSARLFWFKTSPSRMAAGGVRADARRSQSCHPDLRGQNSVKTVLSFFIFVQWTDIKSVKWPVLLWCGGSKSSFFLNILFGIFGWNHLCISINNRCFSSIVALLKTTFSLSASKARLINSFIFPLYLLSETFRFSARISSSYSDFFL